jgi:hypothetical protein
MPAYSLLSGASSETSPRLRAARGLPFEVLQFHPILISGVICLIQRKRALPSR